MDSCLNPAAIQCDHVFITSVIKCHPLQNQRPRSDEINKICINNWLTKQIQLIRPAIIVLLGWVSVDSLTHKQKLKDNYGKLIKENDHNYYITFHPAAGNRNPKIKKDYNKRF